MKVDIVLIGEIDETSADDLRQLNDLFSRGKVVGDLNTIRVSGKKDALVVGIAIATLGATLVGNVVSAIALWQSTRSRYSVTIENSQVSYEVSNLNQKQMQELVSELEENSSDNSQMMVRIGISGK